MTVREQLAAYAHETWSGWMCYLFQFGIQNDDGSFTIDSDKVKRWRRQMVIEYNNLPEGEKESDRDEADKILDILSHAGVL